MPIRTNSETAVLTNPEENDMFWLRSCPKCHGDLHDIHDIGDRYVSCIRCGGILTAEQERILPRATIRPLPRATRSYGYAGIA